MFSATKLKFLFSCLWGKILNDSVEMFSKKILFAFKAPEKSFVNRYSLAKLLYKIALSVLEVQIHKLEFKKPESLRSVKKIYLDVFFIKINFDLI